MAWFVLSVFASVRVCVFFVVAAALDRALLGSKLLLLSVLATDAELPRTRALLAGLLRHGPTRAQFETAFLMSYDFGPVSPF